MRKIACLFAVVILISPLFAQEKSPVSSALREMIQGRSKNMVAAAEEMPADKYSYKATPEQMTFGHLAMHIAEGNYGLCSKIGAIPAPDLPKLNESDAKDKLVERMRASFDFCSTALAKVDDSKLGEMLTLFGERKATRAMAMLILANSWGDHYSLEASYLRANGHLPPTAKK